MTSATTANPAPDRSSDVLFFYRDPGTTGMSAIGILPLKALNKINTGHTSIKTFYAEHNWEYFEMNSVIIFIIVRTTMAQTEPWGDKFYMQRGWGRASATSNPFFVANAWEKWWLG